MTEIEYFGFRSSTSIEEAGIIDQVQDLTIEADEKIMHDYQGRLYDTFPDKIPDFKVLKLHRQAKLTDILSAGRFIHDSDGLIVNAKVREVLERFKTENFRFYDAMVTDSRGKTYPYYVFGVNLTPDAIDYPKSEFMITDYGRETNIEPIALNSFAELESAEERVDNIKLNKVVLEKHWDVLRLPLYYRILVSDQLKQALENAQVTGMNFKDTKLDFFTE